MAAGDSLERDKARWDGKVVENRPRLKGVYVNKKPMRFVSLHHHTTFSYQDGYGMPEAHVRRTEELNGSALAVTEHGNVSSHVKLEQASAKSGVKPIFGCELYTGDVREGRKTQRKNHLTVLASTDEGYRNLLRVVSQGWSDFYYEPTVSGNVLAGHKDGLVVLSGCTGSLLATSLVGGKNIDPAEASYARGRQVAARFKKAFDDSYYLEVQAFPELEVTRTINPMLEQLSQELKIPLVATGDVHYTRPTESEMQMILHNVRGGTKQTLEDQARAWGYDVKLSPPLSDARLLERLVATGISRQAAINAILQSEEISQRCNVALPRLADLRFPTPPGYPNNMAVWRDWLKQGWAFRKCDQLPPSERKRYREQLAREMEVIEGKEFFDYLLIVSDIVKFAKNAGIPVGPARGSAAASIACWLLRITEVNPMIFPGLVFERFIDPTREDPPDVDLDFDSERRSEITDYAIAKYGADCVGNIGTFTMYKSKNSLDDIARVYRIPQYAADEVKSVLIERSSGDLRASATIEDTIEMFEQAQAAVIKFPELMKATKLEGNVKGMGVHSAGLVISNGPITDVCAIYERKVKEKMYQVISLDKYDAERQGLVKIDILGLNTMTMIAEALRLLGMSLDDLYNIPLDDPEVIQGFQENDVVGIFQFDGRAMRSVNGELQPDNFKEVCDVNALARPGPLHNNASAMYVDIKRGRLKPQKIHPLYDAIASETNYQVVYQEQILRIVREIGGFDWTKAAHIRKIISKKLGEQEFNRQWEIFRDGAADRGIDEETARKIWGLCITSGSYAFNASHCRPGSTEIWRPNGPPITLEELYRVSTLHNHHGVGGYRPKGQAYEKVCLSCGAEELTDASQCTHCRHLRRLLEKGKLKCLSMNVEGKVLPNIVRGVFMNGVQPLWALKFSDGTILEATGDHRFACPDGWVTVDDLKEGSIVTVVDDSYTQQRSHRHGLNASRLKGTKNKICSSCGATGLIDVAHLDGDPSNDDSVNLALLCRRCHARHDTQANGTVRKPWAVGRKTKEVKVLWKAQAGVEPVYTLEMDAEGGHNYVTRDGFINHNCVSYGMLAWWCMWMKRHHPLAFYTAMLRKMPEKKQLEYLRDAARHGITAAPPDPHVSEWSWSNDGENLVGGFAQISGIGEVTARKIIAYREEHGINTWDELVNITGIGGKTVEKIRAFCANDDPYGILALHRRLEVVRKELRRLRLPYPTHTSLQVPYSKGTDVPVIWLGVLRDKSRNLRDLFESNFARTGEQLDPKDVQDPDLREWVIGVGQDEDEQVTLTWDRWRYPKFKNAIWAIRPEEDVLLIQGVKKGFQARRAIYVHRMWVIDAEENDQEESEEDYG